MLRRQPALLSVLALAVLTLSVLASCGDREPAQRAAFISFLQNKVMSARSPALPPLSEADKKAIGDYAEHYALLVGFQTKLAEATAQNTSGMLALNKLESLDAIAKERRPLEKAAREAGKLRQTIADLYASADKARDRLKLPTDLAPVYAAAYDKTVRIPAETSGATFAAAADTFTAILDLLDFIDTHNRDLEVTGQDIKVRNPALQEGLDERMQAVREHSRLLKQAYEAQIRAALR